MCSIQVTIATLGCSLGAKQRWFGTFFCRRLNNYLSLRCPPGPDRGSIETPPDPYGHLAADAGGAAAAILNQPS